MTKIDTIPRPVRWLHLIGRQLEPLREAGRTANRLGSAVGAELAAIFLVPLPWFGIVLWIAIAQNNLRYAAFGLFGLTIGHFVARTLGIGDIPMLGGGIKANALLTGLAASWLTAPVAISLQAKILIATIAAVAAAVVTAGIIRALVRTERRRYRPFRAGNGCGEEGGYGLPSLAAGYCIVAGALFALFPAWTSLAVSMTAGWAVPTDPLGWFVVFLRSLGSLLFAPTVPVGAIIAGALLLWSRTLFVTGAVGWLSGAYAAIVMQGLGTNYYWLPASYNFFLAGMALGAVFLLPGRMSLPLAALGGYGASVIAAALQYIAPGWAYLPVSAVLAIWAGLGAFTISEERTQFWRNYARRFAPEDAWWRESNWAMRFGRRDPLVVVPVAGAVQVSQGFDGKLSHRGRWQNALDLQRPPAPEGTMPSTIWDAAVTAPAAGIVERVRDGVPDNPLGICNYADNWGNYVVIRLDQGGWAMLAHLREHSIAVKAGTRVEIGTPIAAVGNSGRSPVPHLHLQVQRAAEPNASTIPFRLANYLSLDASPDSLIRWHATAVPPEKAIVTASRPNPMNHAILASLAPGSAIWVAEAKGEIPRGFRPDHGGRAMQIDVRLDPAGQHVFGSRAAGTMVCSVDADAWRILEISHGASPLFRLLALGVPSIPYAATNGMTWQELAPVNAAVPDWLGLSLLPYLKQPFTYLHCAYRGEPVSEHDPVVVEASPAIPRASLPIKIVTQFELLRGPVKIEATFEEGSVAYSLLSFEPGLPFGERPTT